MTPCACRQRHDMRRIVLTGGPGAGKTAVLELVRQEFCAHVTVLPEAAGIVFGGGVFWDVFGTTLEREMRRYAAVIHLRTPPPGAGYNNGNPLRTETAEAAAAIDAALVTIWEAHPRRFIVPASSDFLEKAARTIGILRNELPECCKEVRHESPAGR